MPRVLIRLDPVNGMMQDYVPGGTRPVTVRFASVSTSALAKLTIAQDGAVIEEVYIGPGSPHSWWVASGQPFVSGDALKPTSRLTFTGEAVGSLLPAIALRMDVEEV